MTAVPPEGTESLTDARRPDGHAEDCAKVKGWPYSGPPGPVICDCVLPLFDSREVVEYAIHQPSHDEWVQTATTFRGESAEADALADLAEWRETHPWRPYILVRRTITEEQVADV